MELKNIYDFVIEEEKNYKHRPVNIAEGWDWSMWQHLTRSFLYKNSQFERENDNRDKRPFKNIVRPILNIQYREEGFDVKDIDIYVDNADLYYKSFLIKKFHEKWALENGIDALIDDIVESYIDYGGILLKKGKKPEVVNLRTLAFCDQTDILSGPFAIKHYLSFQQLRDMAEFGWGDNKKGATIGIEDLILLSQKEEKEKGGDDRKNKTPGRYIEIYEVHGVFPVNYLNREEYKEEQGLFPQMHIIGFYKNEQQNLGVSLFSVKENKSLFKFLARDKVEGRALGYGGIEELVESQIWTNYSEIQIREMLELASKTFFKTTDQKFKTRNNLINADNGQIFDLQQGSDLQQIDTTPRNLVIFQNAIDRWEEHARKMGAASEGLLGEAPTSGTPFKLFEAQNIEAKSMHKYRQGKIAVFMDEVYRDWIIPEIAKEIMNEQEFLSELSADELMQISENIVNNQILQTQKEKILNGELISPQEMELLKQNETEQFFKSNKKFFKILKGEMEKASLQVRTNIIGKQKNLALLTDKLVNVMRQFISTPQIRQDPEMIKLLNVILESSGMSPIMFGSSKPLQVNNTQNAQKLLPMPQMAGNIAS